MDWGWSWSWGWGEGEAEAGVGLGPSLGLELRLGLRLLFEARITASLTTPCGEKSSRSSASPKLSGSPPTKSFTWSAIGAVGLLLLLLGERHLGTRSSRRPTVGTARALCWQLRLAALLVLSRGSSCASSTLSRHSDAHQAHRLLGWQRWA